MARLPGHGGQQQRAAGDGFTMMLGISEADEQAPPVVDQRNSPCEQPAACEVLRREAAPAPLVFQLVERVLAIRPIAIQLTQGQDLVVQRRDQRRSPRGSADRNVSAVTDCDTAIVAPRAGARIETAPVAACRSSPRVAPPRERGSKRDHRGHVAGSSPSRTLPRSACGCAGSPQRRSNGQAAAAADQRRRPRLARLDPGAELARQNSAAIDRGGAGCAAARLNTSSSMAARGVATASRPPPALYGRGRRGLWRRLQRQCRRGRVSASHGKRSSIRDRASRPGFRPPGRRAGCSLAWCAGRGALCGA